MAILSTVTRYLSQRLDYSINYCWTAYKVGHIKERQAWPLFMKCLFKDDMTYLQHVKESVTTLLIRKLIVTGANKRIFVGDVVAFINPLDPKMALVQRVAATEGCKMVSNDKTDKPFVLRENQFWVLSDNEDVKPEKAKDSRTFGPIVSECIVGRAIYIVRSATDHSIVLNSKSGMQMDSPVLEVELDVDELVEFHEAEVEAESAKTKNEDS